MCCPLSYHRAIPRTVWLHLFNTLPFDSWSWQYHLPLTFSFKSGKNPVLSAFPNMLCAPVTLTTLEASAEFAPLCQCLFCTEESFLLTCWPICCWLLLLQRLRAESCSPCCLPGQSRKQLCRTGSCCPRGLPDPILQSCCLDSWVPASIFAWSYSVSWAGLCFCYHKKGDYDSNSSVSTCLFLCQKKCYGTRTHNTRYNTVDMAR